jgi:tetratricopeptide (TPR) repeat protein
MLDFDEVAATAPEWYTAVDDALALGQYEEAGRLARDALLMAEEDPVAKAMSALANAKVSMAKSDPRSAKRKVDDALKFAKQLGDKKVEAAALHRSAKIALESGADKAIDQATEALNLYKSVSDDIGMASVKVTLGKAHLPLDLEKARDYANEASHIFTKSSEKKGQAAALHVLFSLMLRTGRLNNAAVLVGEMERCYRIAGDLPNASTCQLLAAQVHLSGGKFKDALELAQAVKRLAEGLGDEKKQAAAAYMTASTMDASGRLKDAETAAYDAWSLMRNVRDKAGMASALEVMASCLAKKKQYSSAVQKLEEASSLYRQLKDARMEAKILKKKEAVVMEDMLAKGEIAKPKPKTKEKEAPIKEFMDCHILRSQFDGKTHRMVDWDEHESRVATHMAQGGGEETLDVAKLGINRPSAQEVLYDVQWKSLTKGALIDLPTPLDEPILA